MDFAFKSLILLKFSKKLIDTRPKRNTEVDTMNRKLYSVVLITFLSTAIGSFAQGHGQGHGPASGLPAGAQIEHGGGNHGQNDHGQPNKPAETNKSVNSGKNDVVVRLRENPDLA